MRLRAILFSGMIASLGALVPATASGCEAKAREVAQAQNARLLAVTVDGNKCVVRLLIKRPNKPPQRKTVVVDR